ncbi:50S ribosomal protein L28 [Candidatus Uhrbacteria bacterium]|nr:50S ribosomal protein L28 [Candidatus Uhrbacteria bacterium]
MSQRCSSCRRKALSGNSRSHSNIKTRTKQGVNLQSKRVDGIRVLLCTSCMKSKLRQ